MVAETREDMAFYTSDTTVLKALLSFSLIWLSLSGFISSQGGASLSVLLAFPQLCRVKGPTGRQMRVVLGPLTPILAANNICNKQSPCTVSMFCVSLAAFVVLRPDNTAVLDLFSSADECSAMMQYLGDSKNRRKVHGILAAINTSIALLMIWVQLKQLKTENPAVDVSDSDLRVGVNVASNDLF